MGILFFIILFLYFKKIDDVKFGKRLGEGEKKFELWLYGGWLFGVGFVLFNNF